MALTMRMSADGQSDAAVRIDTQMGGIVARNTLHAEVTPIVEAKRRHLDHRAEAYAEIFSLLARLRLLLTQLGIVDLLNRHIERLAGARAVIGKPLCRDAREVAARHNVLAAQFHGIHFQLGRRKIHYVFHRVLAGWQSYAAIHTGSVLIGRDSARLDPRVVDVV